MVAEYVLHARAVCLESARSALEAVEQAQGLRPLLANANDPNFRPPPFPGRSGGRRKARETIDRCAKEAYYASQCLAVEVQKMLRSPDWPTAWTREAKAWRSVLSALLSTENGPHNILAPNDELLEKRPRTIMGVCEALQTESADLRVPFNRFKVAMAEVNKVMKRDSNPVVTDDDQEWAEITPADLAKLRGVTVDALRRQRKRGDFKAVNVNKNLWRVPQSFLKMLRSKK